MVFRSLPALPALPPRLQKAAPYLLLALAVVAAYFNTFQNTFVYDDYALIVGNAFLRSWHSIGTIFMTPAFAGANIGGHYYRPLQLLLYLIIYQTGGASPFGFHLLNLALHAANACLLYALGRKLNFNAGAVFLAALIWAVHPINVEAVAYMSGTADPLFVTFSLAALLVLLPDFTLHRMLKAAPLLVLALLAKEEAIIFPLLAMSCVFFVSEKRYSLKGYICTWPLWLIVGAYLLAHTALSLTAGHEQVPEMASHSQKIHGLYLAPPPYTCLAALTAYMRLLFAPEHLHYERSFPFYAEPWHADVIAGFAMFLLAFYQVFWRQSRNALPLSWGILWFMAAYFLHSGIPLTFDKPVLEHFMYLPSAGLFLGIAETVSLLLMDSDVRKFRAINFAGALFLAAGFGLQTHYQNRVWHDPQSLYLNIFDNGETSPKAHVNLGAFYAEHGAHARAIEQFRQAIGLSDDKLAEAQYDLAVELLAERDGDSHEKEAIDHLRRALDIDPDYYFANKKLGEMYARAGDKENAAIYLGKAEELHRKLAGSAP